MMMQTKRSVFLRVLMVILIYLFAISGLYGEEEQFPYMGIVTAEKLRVLPRKGTNYMEITELKQHDLVTVIGREGDWLRIVPPDDIACWIKGDYIVDGTVSGTAVNVRSGPGIKHRILGQVNKGDLVNEIEEKDTWIHIDPPDTLTAYIKADFAKYFSGMNNVDFQLNKLREGKELFDSAVKYAKSELLKSELSGLDYDTMKNNFYQVVKEFPATIQAKKSLYYLGWIKEERKKREEKIFQKEQKEKLKQIFSVAEDTAREEMAKEDFRKVDVESIRTNYLYVVKEFPKSKEAEWAVDRIAEVQERMLKFKQQDREKRQEVLREAEEYREEQLIKKVDEVDYSGIISKYREVTILFPGTTEAKQAAERLQDIIEREKLAYARTSKSTDLLPFHSFEGILVLEAENTEAGNFYRVEAKRFLSRKTLCYFYSSDPKITYYANKKVFVEGIVNSFDRDNNPIIDLTRIQRR